MSHPNIERKMAELPNLFDDEVRVELVIWQDELRGFWWASINVDGEPDTESRAGATDPASALDSLEAEL